ncbi:hypothetical protein EG19_06580 [Thermoanaerobaculum aquaticum]|uniref:RHS repeat-associated core domain-containing protein n=1 Tax=Thermoanaerobaculum aquaticum TaxID=1312852 RepID=A0A062XV21_9BACT|nr:RHS repeat-associated core domain-containing protein [Thermoanaerobaculum aquaticum]KDA53244.1 hypothetical protein EG19_06580 [Thermoanaerobaculum aquaticum]
MRQLVMSGYSATYGYDARDERVAWVDSTEGGIHYTLRGLSNEILREVHELNGVWTWRKDYIFAGTTHIATADSSGLTHVHKDHLGSTRVITSASGSIVSQHRYWPFGEEMTATSSPERMRFAGHERDSQTSLDYMHARYYAPFGGRFLSVDPGRDFDPSHPQSWNLYAYVRNNPVSAVDPTGKDAAELAENAKRLVKVASEYIDSQVGGDPAGVMVMTITGILRDVASGVADMLKVGQETGEAIGRGAETEDVVRAISQDVGRAAGLVLMIAGPANSTIKAAAAGNPAQVAKGTTLFRVWGDGSGPWGRSWTPVNPATIPNYRNAAGLPVTNTGRFVSEAILTDTTGVTTRRALPLHGNSGGLPEVVVPKPESQLVLVRVSGVNPPF